MNIAKHMEVIFLAAVVLGGGLAGIAAPAYRGEASDIVIAAPVITVTIIGKRMNAEQKARWDAGANVRI